MALQETEEMTSVQLPSLLTGGYALGGFLQLQRLLVNTGGLVWHDEVGVDGARHLVVADRVPRALARKNRSAKARVDLDLGGGRAKKGSAPTGVR